jgi:hydroxyacylglutathione hydrolase
VFFVESLTVESLGNRAYLTGGPTLAVAVDVPRDVDRMLAAAARRGVRIAYVAETHVHNDHVSGGLELARLTGARYLVPDRARVAFDRVPVADADEVDLGEHALTLRAVATPGHTPHHLSYVLTVAGRPAAAFSGGSLLIGTVGRPDLVDPRLTAELAHAQHDSAHRLAAELDDDVRVLPTHGFDSFCASGAQSDGEDETTIGRERTINDALRTDPDAFVADLIAGLDDIPAYYAHIGPLNAEGPAPVDLTPPRPADGREIADRLADGEWVVDLRSRTAYADGHVAGALNFELDGKLAAYLPWLMPRGKPVTLLAENEADVAAAQRELVQVGIDRPAAAATGAPADWTLPGEHPSSYPRARFADLAEALASGGTPGGIVVLDVRRNRERAAGTVEGSVHIPVHELPHRTGDVPDGTVWVHCATGMRATMAASLLDAVGRDVVAVDDTFPAGAARAGLAPPPTTS